MLTYVMESHGQYVDALERKRKAAGVAQKQHEEKKRAAALIKQLQAKKAKVAQDAAAEAYRMDLEILQLRKDGK